MKLEQENIFKLNTEQNIKETFDKFDYFKINFCLLKEAVKKKTS